MNSDEVQPQTPYIQVNDPFKGCKQELITTSNSIKQQSLQLPRIKHRLVRLAKIEHRYLDRLSVGQHSLEVALMEDHQVH